MYLVKIILLIAALLIFLLLPRLGGKVLQRLFAKSYFYYVGWWLTFLLMLAVPALMIYSRTLQGGPDFYEKYQCKNPLPIEGDRVIVKTIKGGLTLRVPQEANIIRNAQDGCEKTQEFQLNYTWYNGKIITSRKELNKIPIGKGRIINVIFNGYAYSHAEEAPHIDIWRYEPSILHQKYPLIYYPRFKWESLSGPEYPYQRIGSWGIRGTYDPVYKKPFVASCGIKPIDPKRPGSVVEGDIAGDGDCRGGISAVKNGKVIGARFIVQPQEVPNIDKIIADLAKELETYIKE